MICSEWWKESERDATYYFDCYYLKKRTAVVHNAAKVLRLQLYYKGKKECDILETMSKNLCKNQSCIKQIAFYQQNHLHDPEKYLN